MTKEERIKELLDKYEEEGCTLAYEYDQKTNELPEPFSDDVTDEEWEDAKVKASEIEKWYKQELEAREQRFIRAIAAMEG